MKQAKLFEPTKKGNLFLDGECDCADCLMRKMLARSPGEILFRAWKYLVDGRGPCPVEVFDVLRTLEAKVEGGHFSVSLKTRHHARAERAAQSLNERKADVVIFPEVSTPFPSAYANPGVGGPALDRSADGAGDHRRFLAGVTAIEAHRRAQRRRDLLARVVAAGIIGAAYLIWEMATR